MRLETIPGEFTICKVSDDFGMRQEQEFCFVSRTDQEISVVCRTEDVPQNVTDRADGWRAFRVQGTLDFSLTGILAGISGVLAEQGIGIFAVSTYQTDYILTKAEDFQAALLALEKAGYQTEDD